MASSSKELYNRSQLIEEVSRVVPPGSAIYARVCYLLSAILPSNAPKINLNGSKLLSQVYNETLKDKIGGWAKLWYILNEVYGLSDITLTKIREHVTETYIVPKELTPRVHLRTLVLRVVSEVAKDKEQAIGLVHTAGVTLKPSVSLMSLPRPFEENDYTLPLLKLFEQAEQQCVVNPNDLGTLRQWLVDFGYHLLVKDHLDTYDPQKEIKILGKLIIEG